MSFGDKVGYASTLAEALEQVLTGSSTQVPGGNQNGNNTTP